MGMVRRAGSWLIFIALAGIVALSSPWQYLPAHWNPWEPLGIDHPMTPVSKWKLRRLHDHPEQCLSLLAAAPADVIDYTPLQDYTPVTGCPLTNVVRIARTSVEFNARFTVTCPLAVAWTMFEHQQLQPLAQRHFATPVQRVEHYGSFACRNIYHREDDRRSQHASANAFDVAGFRLADGTRITVLRDWDNPAAAGKSAFLQELHAKACNYFGTALGPNYNQPHENHFHLDGSGYGFCR